MAGSGGDDGFSRGGQSGYKPNTNWACRGESKQEKMRIISMTVCSDTGRRHASVLVVLGRTARSASYAPRRNYCLTIDDRSIFRRLSSYGRNQDVLSAVGLVFKLARRIAQTLTQRDEPAGGGPACSGAPDTTNHHAAQVWDESGLIQTSIAVKRVEFKLQNALSVENE